MKKYLNFLFKLVFFANLLIIEYLATTSRSFEIVQKSWDKANHFLAFMVLYVLISLAYDNLKIKSKFWILFAFGFQIELVQSFLPFRHFSLLDIFADIIGIFLGIFALKLISEKLKLTKY